MKPFRDWTIKARLSLAMMTASLAAILLAGVVTITFSLHRWRREHIRDMYSIAHVLSENLQAALVFEMPEDAEKLLASLAVNRSVIMAAVYDAQGVPIASYRRPDAPPGLTPPPPQPEGYAFQGPYLSMFHAIKVDNRRIGTLYIRDDRHIERERFWQDVRVWSLAMVLGLALAFLVAQYLQQLISHPIITLTHVAEKVARSRDYSIRTRKQGNDEIGRLMHAFDEMMSRIQAAQQALRQSEERFRDFFHQAPIGFHIFGPDRLFVDINQAELDMVGYTRDEVIGRLTLTDLVMPQQKDQARRHWDEIAAAGAVKNAEYTLLHKDGRHVNVIVNASALLDENGTLVRTRGSVIDITERKRMLGKLRESQAMLQNVLDTINVRVFWKDNQLRYRGCNRLFALDAGLDPPEQIVGKTDMDLPWKLLAAAYRRDDRQVIDSGEPRLSYEEPLTTPQGKSLWVNTSKIPLRDAENRIIGVLGTYQDVTESKRAELALRLSEQRFRAIANYTCDWELWISPEGHVLWTNPAVERITGYSVAEFMALGSHPGPVVFNEDKDLVAEAFDDALRGGSGKQLEFRIRRKDGCLLWVSMAWQPIFDNKGVSQGHRESIEDISQKKQAEIELEHSRERFRSLVETTSDWIWETDVNNRYTYVSPAVNSLLGYEPHEILGKTRFELMSPQEARRVSPLFRDIAAEARPFRALENVHLAKDGRQVTLETSGVPVYDLYGNFAGYRGIDRDVTERKQAEDRLRETMQMLKLVLDAIPARVFWKDRNGVFLGCNTLFARDAALENPEDIIGRTDYDMPWTKEESDSYIEHDRRVIETGTPEYHIMETQLHADGRLAWLETNKVPLRDAQGNVVGVLGSYEDITQRRISENAMRAIVEGTARATGQDFLSSLVRHLAAAISCKYVLLAELVEPEMDHIRTMAVWARNDYVPNFDFPVLGTPFEHVAYGEPSVCIEGLRKHFPECEKLRDMNAQCYIGVPLFDSAGRTLGVIAAIDDKPLQRVDFAKSVMSIFATRAAVELERKQAEEERERLLRTLEQKNRELESIVYTSSHDLRSTVVNVQGFSAELSATCTSLLSLLDKVPVPHEKLKEELLTMLHDDIPTELRFITASAAKMDMLIAGLLKLSRLGRVRLNLQPVDMNLLIRQVVDGMQYQLRQVDAEVSIETLPPCTADPDLLVQVFANLLDNAVKYRRPEWPPRIEVSGRVDEQMSVYCVADNGPGILPRHQTHIFEVFHRLDPEGPVSGDGLGLAIVRRIVDRHAGRVWVQSAPEQGSGFFVAIPTA